MSDIKRFELLPSDGECFLEEDVCCDGSLVYYEDHREVIKNLEKQLAEAREDKQKVLKRVEEIYEDLISGEGITECLEELQEQLKGTSK